MITSALVAWSLGAERTQLPVSARADAQEALDRARGGGALRFAADALAQADSLFLAASREATRVSAWPRPFRDFRTASALYRQTEAAADSSLALAESTQQNAAMEAGSVLEAARDALEVAEECRVASRTVHRHLAQARQLFHEAQALEAQARYGEASSRARASLAEAGKVCDAAGGLVARFADPEAVKRWQGWIRETIQESRASGAVALIVIKELNELRLYRGGKLVKTYAADVGASQVR